MTIKSAYSSKSDLSDLTAELKAQLAPLEPKLVVFFASSCFAPEAVAAAMAQAFPGAETFGCSTAGEIVTGGMLTNSVVAMAFDRHSVLRAKVEVVEDLSVPSRKAFDSFESFYGTTMAEMDPCKYLGLVLIDGMSGKEELVIDRMGDLTNINFVGGSAGDDLKFAATYVYANGKSYSNAAALAIVEPATPFTFIKTQSFRQLPTQLVVTKANEFSREVIEFNGKPAAQAYAEALGVSVEEAPKHFMHNPIGLVIEGEPYVRSPQQIKGNSMFFYCSVMEGMELYLLESTDIIADTAGAIAAARQTLGGLSAIINFNCILRTLELGEKGASAAYGGLFNGVETVGFSTYGEQFIGHINQTATMVALK